MLIYILHRNELYTYRLPKEVSGSYVLNDYDEEGRNRNLVNISSQDGKWFLNSNDEVFITTNDGYVNKIELREFCFYTLQYLKKENIILYILPGDDFNYNCYSVNKETSLIFGNDSNCDVIYSSPNISAQQFELTNSGGIWQYKNLQPNIPIYINKKRKDFCNLYSFDTLFAMGLKIVILANKLIIFSPSGTVNCYNSKLVSDNKSQLAVADNKSEEIVKDFYDQNEYFSKSPVFRKKEEIHNVTITGPQEKEKSSDSSMISDIVPSALMSITSLISVWFTIQNYNSGTVEKETFITSIVMCIVMLITGIVWPIIEYFASKIKRVITEKMRKLNYKKYLKRKKKVLTTMVSEQKAILEFNSLSLSECQNAIAKRTSYLFSRTINLDSFLSIKLGVGKIESNINFEYKRPDLIIDNDKLLDEIDKLIDEFRYVEDAPFCVDLKDNSFAIINNSGNYDDFLNVIILQLIALHDYSALKLVILTDEFSSLNKLKNLNHCWSNDKSFRYFASNIKDSEIVSGELIKTFNKNKSIEERNAKSTYYLVISDCIQTYKGLSIVEKIMLDNKNSNFSMLMFANKMSDIPTGCHSFITYNDKEASFFKSEMEEGTYLKFKPQLLDNSINYDKCIYMLSNIPIKLDSESQGNLPDKLGFLEMYGVGNLDQLNIINKWNTSTIVSSLAAPIGVDASGNTLILDLHEKKHGPHGLIAGMTGSGKSEFIITYILSLAISYSPDEVQFVLIDYKGGGLAGAFENRKTGIKLPHLVGTITNLDKSEMNRTLVSIKSELQRRQRKFNEAKEYLNTGSIDIYKYQSLVREGALKEPMSHLFIICDEFAELKAQQPDFMDELVSAARIGRSLGIHLILATQKPSGVVDEQIWSNAKFKVCCKVQTADDSKEMIRRPDAAYLKEAGRFYLLVGYDQYFVEGQSGYSGVQYIPSSKAISKLDNSISFVNNIGDAYKNVSKKDDMVIANQGEKLGEELNNILKYIVDIANENHYEYHQLWLDNVPKLLYYNDLIKKYPIGIKPFDINPIIGEYDDPEHQSQNYVSLSITTKGNIVVLGSSGMGKNTLYSTIIYSTIINHRPDEVNFYIVDFGSEKLKKFSKAPHVGDVVGINDKNKISYLFYMIEGEINKRKKYYSENGRDFSMDVKSGKSIFPNIIIMIYGMEVFREVFEDIYDSLFSSITRSCSKYGINFIVSGSSPTSLGYTVENNFPQKVALNLVDPTDYELYFSNYTLPSKNPGRGLIEIDGNCMQFQTSIIFSEDEEKKNLDYVISKLNEFFSNKANPIPDVPKRLEFSYLSHYIGSLDMVPMGINIVTAQLGYFDFSQKVSLMSTEKLDVFSKFMPKFLSLLTMAKDNNVIVLNTLDNLKLGTISGIKYYDSNFTKIIPVLLSNISKINTVSSNKKFTIVVLGYSKLSEHLSKLKEEDENVCLLDDLILNTKNDSFKFVLFDPSSTFRKIMNSSFSEYVDNQYGIWVGGDFDMQDCFIYDNMSFMNNIKTGNDTIVIVKDSIPEYLKFPTI